jgi:hypothetical protein
MNDEYLKEQAQRVRALAENADPFTKRRLLDLAERYDARLGRPSRATRVLGSLAANNQQRPDHRNDG